MKWLLLLPIIVILLVCSCGGLFCNDATEEFIPGVYIRFSKHEYGTEYDTVIITVQNKRALEYTIHRKWKYERVLDGAYLEPEYKKKTSAGIYNQKSNLLEEMASGNQYSFDSKKKRLFHGATEYQKIK